MHCNECFPVNTLMRFVHTLLFVQLSAKLSVHAATVIGCIFSSCLSFIGRFETRSRHSSICHDGVFSADDWHNTLNAVVTSEWNFIVGTLLILSVVLEQEFIGNFFAYLSSVIIKHRIHVINMLSFDDESSLKFFRYADTVFTFYGGYCTVFCCMHVIRILTLPYMCVQCI